MCFIHFNSYIKYSIQAYYETYINYLKITAAIICSE